MIDKSSVVESLRKLAEKIKDSDPGGVDRLNLLGNAIQNPAQSDGWSYADVHSMIAPDSIVERYRNSLQTGMDRIVTFLEIIRNTFIFAPIIVTWYGISQATEKYNDLISAAIRAKQLDLYSQPFLYLWQQRFGGSLPGYLTLSSIALVDVLILLFILTFTFFAYVLSNTSTARKDQDAQRLRANLNHAITGAILSLHARPQLTAGNNLELVARNLDTMVRGVVNQVDAMSQQVVGRLDRLAQETTTRIDRVAQETTGRFDRVARDVTGAFSNATQQTRNQLQNIVNEMTRQVEAGKQYLSELGSLTSGVVKTSTEIQTAANALKTTNDSLINGVNKLIIPAEAMAKQQAQLLDAVRKSVDLLQANAKAIGDLGVRQQKMSEDLAETLDSLTLAVEKFETLGKQQSSLVSQQSTFLQHLQDEHDKQGNLAVLLSDATVGVKNALSEMSSGAISLRSMAVSLDEIMRLQARLVSNPGMAAAVDLSNITRSYENAAQVMESSGNTLKTSAIAIQRASQQLRDVLDTVQVTQNGHS